MACNCGKRRYVGTSANQAQTTADGNKVMEVSRAASEAPTQRTEPTARQRVEASRRRVAASRG